jgi:hypothetical protein
MQSNFILFTNLSYKILMKKNKGVYILSSSIFERTYDISNVLKETFAAFLVSTLLWSFSFVQEFKF